MKKLLLLVMLFCSAHIAYGMDQSPDEALLKASELGDAGQVEQLIKAGANINCRDSAGWTSLHWAAACGWTPIVKVLVSSNANVDSISDKKKTPLHVAVEHSHFDIVTFLLEQGASPNEKDVCFMTPLSYAEHKKAIHLRGCKDLGLSEDEVVRIIEGPAEFNLFSPAKLDQLRDAFKMCEMLQAHLSLDSDADEPAKQKSKSKFKRFF